MRELETEMTEMKAHNEDLGEQLDDKERKCRDTEVPLSCTAYMCAASSICVVPGYSNCNNNMSIFKNNNFCFVHIEGKSQCP